MPSPSDELAEYLSGTGERCPPQVGSFDLQDCECTRPGGEPLNLRRIVFTGDVAFHNVTFRVPLCLDQAEFQGKVAFKYCKFSTAMFTAARFRQKVDFTMSAFNLAYFWRALFAGPAMMQEMKVSPAGTQDTTGSIFDGETNFSYAYFADRATFTRAQMRGPIIFYGTRFLHDAHFDEVIFGGPLRFETPRGNQITIAERDFADVVAGTWPGIDLAALSRLSPPDRGRVSAPGPYGPFHRLLFRGVIRQSGEHGKDPLHLAAVDYADFLPFNVSPEALEKELQALPPAERDVFAIVRDTLTGLMFQDDKEITFEGAEFAPTDADAPASRFANVNLNRCLFGGTNLNRVVFQDVTWDERSMIFWTRSALYEVVKDFAQADAFQCSEMEMERRAGSSLRLFHKFLNAYNTSLVLPIIWLLALSLVIFPVLYLAIGSVSSIRDGVVYALSIVSLTKFTVTAELKSAAIVVQIVQLTLSALLLLPIAFTVKRRLRWF